MNKSQDTGKLAEALAKAQQEIKPPAKNKTVKVASQRGSYEFRYSTLDAVMNAIRDPLTKNGLAISQGVARVDNRDVLVTMLMHSSGEWISGVVPLDVQQPGMQALGSGIAYARRYGVSNIVGVVADDDDDGNAADGNKVEEVKGKPNMAPLPGHPPASPLLKKVGKKMKELSLSLDDIEALGYGNPRDLSDSQLASLLEKIGGA